MGEVCRWCSSNAWRLWFIMGLYHYSFIMPSVYNWYLMSFIRRLYIFNLSLILSLLITKSGRNWIGVCKLLPDDESFEKLACLWSLKVAVIMKLLFIFNSTLFIMIENHHKILFLTKLCPAAWSRVKEWLLHLRSTQTWKPSK